METRNSIKYNKIPLNELNIPIYNNHSDDSFEDEDEDEDIRNGCFPRKNTIIILVRELLKINPKII